MSTLTKKMKDHARFLGATVVGVASVERFKGAPKGHHPEDILPGARSVLVIGMPLLNSINGLEERMKHSAYFPEKDVTPVLASQADEKVQRQTITYVRKEIELYNYLSMYDLLNTEIERQAFKLGVELEVFGYSSIWLPTTSRILKTRMQYGNVSWGKYMFSPFSHRHAAVLAGLGTIGLNNLLITPEWGPRIRVNSIITTAQLEPDPILEQDVCLGEKCGKCLKKCPAKAYTNERISFEMAGSSMIMSTLDKEKCLKQWEGYYDVSAGGHCQGACISFCPVGKGCLNS